MTKQKQEKVNSDLLGAYPERKQVSAFPERVFIKTNRFLVVFTIINLALMIALSVIFSYMAKHTDVRVSTRQGNAVFSIDPLDYTLSSMEGYRKKVSALTLAMEDQLRKYIIEWHSVPYEWDRFQQKVSEGSLISRTSVSEIAEIFKKDQSVAYNEVVNQKKSIRDVHIYDFHQVGGSLWTAYIETFDLPIAAEGDSITCDCSDNSKACINCKIKNATANGRKRYKIWIRAIFTKNSTIQNPLGLYVYQYSIGTIPIHTDPNDPLEDKEKFWGLPPALRPTL